MILRRGSSLLYLLALFFVGLGYLAMMPVFEGFDERAHYSSMRQIADTATIPVLGESAIDQNYADYQGPKPYTHLDPPFDSDLSYSKFFNRPELAAPYRRAYREIPSSSPFRPGQELNWQAQHPPLYYMLMAPLVNAVSHFSFVTQFFILRLASFLLALAGVAFGLLAVGRADAGRQTDRLRLGFYLYPIILPMFFPEFTRIGNDALSLFGVGVLAYLLSLWRRDEGNLKLSLAIGVALGLGLLTKAFFIPITAALAVFLLTRLRLDKPDAATGPRRRLGLLCIFYPALMIGGGWCLRKLAMFGKLIGDNDALYLAQHGGLIAGLKAHFSFHDFVRSLTSTITSYSWAGTWSLARVPLPFYIPLLVLILLVFGACMLQLKKRRMTDYAWLPFWLFVFFGAGLFYHFMIGLAINGSGQTPGWYLHILMPFAAPAMGIGVCSLMQVPRAKPFVIGLLLYACLFQIAALWAQFALFTGCATKGNDTYYAFPDHAFCLDQAPVLIHRLAVLGYPLLAAVGFGGGAVCALVLLFQRTRGDDREIRLQGASEP